MLVSYPITMRSTMTQFKTLAVGTNHTSLIICDGELKVVRFGEVIAVITNW